MSNSISITKPDAAETELIRKGLAQPLAVGVLTYDLSGIAWVLSFGTSLNQDLPGLLWTFLLILGPNGRDYCQRKGWDPWNLPAKGWPRTKTDGDTFAVLNARIFDLIRRARLAPYAEELASITPIHGSEKVVPSAHGANVLLFPGNNGNNGNNETSGLPSETIPAPPRAATGADLTKLILWSASTSKDGLTSRNQLRHKLPKPGGAAEWFAVNNIRPTTDEDVERRLNENHPALKRPTGKH